MSYDIRLESPSVPRPTAVVRLRASLPDLPKVIPPACGKVWNMLKAQQVRGAGRHVTLCLDDEINLEVGVELERSFAGHGDVVGSELPVGPVATTVHLGPYQQLKASHQAIRNWCSTNGHALAGPYWEIYGHWDDAWNTDPSKIRTDVFYLLK